MTQRLRVLLPDSDERFAAGGQRIVTDAAEIVQNPAGLSARDAAHAAVMERHGITRIASFDSDCDRWPGVTRLHTV